MNGFLYMIIMIMFFFCILFLSHVLCGNNKEIPPEKCYIFHVNIRTNCEKNEGKPTDDDIEKVKSILTSDFDNKTDMELTCKTSTVTKEKIRFQNVAPCHLNLSFIIEPKGSKTLAYNCGQNMLHQGLPKAFQSLVAIPVTTKDYKIKSDSCCEKDDFTEKPCCRKGYTLKNQSCVKDCSTTGETNLMTREPDDDCPKTSKLSLGVKIAVGVSSFLVLVCIVLAAICAKKYHNARRKDENDVETNVDTSTSGENQNEESNNQSLEYIKMNSPRQRRPISHSELCFTLKRYIPRTDIQFTKKTLGRGQFGQVEHAYVKIDDTHMQCAIKMIRGGGTDDDQKALFDELEILNEITHENVVSLLGACVDENSPLYVVMEYCEKGNLLKYLQHHKYSSNTYVNYDVETLDFRWKIRRAIEICKGMIFLSQKKIVHRDLAARNILLNNDEVAKISDFGLARDVYLRRQYHRTKAGFLPLRWMAIEALESSVYTTKSDVWSFAILLWELFMDGQTPYPKVADNNILLEKYLKTGYRMPQPENCPESFYNLMEKCWLPHPDSRPSFAQALRTLNIIEEEEMRRESQSSRMTEISDMDLSVNINEEETNNEERQAVDKLPRETVVELGIVNQGRDTNSDNQMDAMDKSHC